MRDLLLGVISIFILGLIIFFISHLRNTLYTEFDDYFNSTSDFNDSEARTALSKINTVENALWDWVFLAVFAAVMLNMIIFSFATRISLAFYWLFAILGIVILIVGTTLSAMWQETASNPAFAETLTNFPVMNLMLGNYFPMMVVLLLFVMMIILFGKRTGGDRV